MIIRNQAKSQSRRDSKAILPIILIYLNHEKIKPLEDLETKLQPTQAKNKIKSSQQAARSNSRT